jgi:hypothetical protein
MHVVEKEGRNRTTRYGEIPYKEKRVEWFGGRGEEKETRNGVPKGNLYRVFGRAQM